MQRHDPDGVVLVCDFCRRDWDGQFPAIEGHRGSIICLDCLQTALRQRKELQHRFTCVMCQRVNIPGSVGGWPSPKDPATFVCHECMVQAAGTFSKDPDVEWTWDRKVGQRGPAGS